MVLGASGHGKVVADTAREAGFEVVGFADDDPGRRGAVRVGVPVRAIGPDELLALLASEGAELVLAIGTTAAVGANAILNTGCSVDHDNALGDHVHVSPGGRLGGTVAVGEGTHIGIGASVRNNLTIGAWSTVGAGAVVVKPVPDRVVVVGTPARVLRPA